VAPALPPVPPANKFVPTPPKADVKSIYAPLADPPCSKNLNLFCHTSIVTPVPPRVLFVAGLASSISPPSSASEFDDFRYFPLRYVPSHVKSDEPPNEPLLLN
jgi:hypothetical protein